MPTVSEESPLTSDRTVIVTEPPAGTINNPAELLKLTIVDETAAPSVNLSAPLNK